MMGLAYERIFSSPIKSTLPCTVSLRGNRRSAACGGYSEAVSRKCPGFHAVQAAGNRLTRRCVLLPTFPTVDKKRAVGGTVPTKEKHPSERKRKPAKRERIPTTSLRTGLGMTGLAYERIFSGPIKSVPFCVNPFSTVEWRPFRRKEKIVLAFCRRGIYNSIKSIKGQSVRRLVRRRRNRVRSPASWSL